MMSPKRKRRVSGDDVAGVETEKVVVFDDTFFSYHLPGHLNMCVYFNKRPGRPEVLTA